MFRSQLAAVHQSEFFMSSPTLLLTSFRTWKSEQSSNASDDLLMDVSHRYPQRSHLRLLRQIPVDFQIAPQQVIKAIQSHAPHAVICCGMGETRTMLCVEDRATDRGRIRYTGVNVNRLISGLPVTRVSQDAGQFVCNSLYFDVLDYLQSKGAACPCIFVHVPVLTAENHDAIAADFQSIILRMKLLVSQSTPRSIPLFNPLPV